MKLKQSVVVTFSGIFISAAVSLIFFMATVPSDEATRNLRSYRDWVDLLVSVFPLGEVLSSASGIKSAIIGASGIAAAFAAWAITKRIKRSLVLRERRATLAELDWVFHYGPGQGAFKAISFNDDGSIGEGQNHNEFRWVIAGPYLDIFRKDGSLQNRFAYDPGLTRFRSIEHSDAQGFKGQSIEPSDQPATATS